MTERLKVYGGNYDGRRRGLIAAKNQKEAAAIAHSSVYGFRQFWSETHNHEEIATALQRPRTLLLRLFNDREGEWLPDTPAASPAPGRSP